MAQTIQLKRSSTSGATPSAGSLSAGELAVNTADGKVFLKKANGNVVGLTDGLQTSLANITHANSTLISGTNWVRGDVQVYTSGSYTKKQYNGFYSTANGAEPASFQVGLACLTTSTNALHDEHFLEVSESGVFLGSSDLTVNSLSQLYAQRDNIQITFAPGDTHPNQRTQLSMLSGSIGDLTGNSSSTSLTSQNLDDQVGIQLANNGTHALATLLMPTTLTLLYGANSILTRGYADSRYLTSTQTITNTFNGRSGNVTLTANDVTSVVDANYIQVWKDTQTTAGILTQFPKYGSITSSSGLIQGYSRGLLTSNTSGTVTKTIFDGSLLASSTSTAALQYKAIGFNSNDTGSANSSRTGRVMVGQYGEIFLDSVTKANANTITSATFELTGGVRPQGTTQLYDPHLPSGIRCKYTAGATGSYNPSNYEEVPEAGYYRSAEYTINQLSQAVTYSNGTSIGRPSQFQMVARSSWPGTDSNLSFSQAYDYRTTLALGESAELIFQNFGRTALRTPNMTDYSILTRGYADARYAGIGSSGGIFDGGSATSSDNTFDGGSATG